MCGIAGAIGFVDDEIQEAIKNINSHQKHRGPDGSGYWSNVKNGAVSEQGVAFAHTRLSILDLTEAGAQPMTELGSGCVITYNGEVYNYKELRNQLLHQNLSFYSDCDTEVIIKSLAHNSISSLSAFNGMFAFAYWDPRDKKVTLVRDRMGIKPLYYATINFSNSRTTTFFASELRALLSCKFINRTLDKTALSNFLWNGFVSGSQSIVSGVKLLSPGSTMDIVPGFKPEKEISYWSLDSIKTSESTSLNELDETFSASVKRRLVSDVPLGIFLSGGVDSSAVAAAACKASVENVKTFNIGFPEQQFDESQYAQRVADSLGTEHSCINLTESLFVGDLNNALNSIDQPSFDGINTYYVSKAVKDAGITVALAGTGGDELFGGYTSFTDLPKVQNLSKYTRHLPDSLISSLSRLLTRVKVGKFGAIPPQTRWGKLSDALLTKSNLLQAYQVSYSNFTQEFSRELAPSLEFKWYGLDESYYKRNSDINHLSQLEQISKFELENFVSQRLLRDTDFASMAVSLEVRVPLLDHEFIEKVWNFPESDRFNPIGKKQLLKQIALKEIPKEIFDRPKSGFVFPLDLWIRNSMEKDVKEMLYDSALCQSVGLDPQSVRKIWKAFIDKSPGIYFSRIWVIYILLYWCNRHSISL